jgi:hypothetical protein
VAQDRHITSSAISTLRQDLVQNAKPSAETAKRKVDDTDLDFPYFGVLGIVLSPAYSGLQDYARQYCQAAADEMEEWEGKLKTVQENWRAAEEANQVQYR